MNHLRTERARWGCIYATHGAGWSRGYLRIFELGQSECLLNGSHKWKETLCADAREFIIEIAGITQQLKGKRRWSHGRLLNLLAISVVGTLVVARTRDVGKNFQ